MFILVHLHFNTASTLLYLHKLLTLLYLPYCTYIDVLTLLHPYKSIYIKPTILTILYLYWCTYIYITALYHIISIIVVASLSQYSHITTFHVFFYTYFTLTLTCCTSTYMYIFIPALGFNIHYINARTCLFLKRTFIADT